MSSKGIAHLLKPVTKDGVWDALRFMKPFKSLEPNKFQPFFFKNYWHVVDDDVWNLVNRAFDFGCFDPRLIETLITLILKVDNPMRLGEFRPINNCNVDYKLIIEVIVNRLQPFFSSIF